MKMSDLQNLDPAKIGSWPLPVRALMILGLCLALLAGGFYLDTQIQIENLEKTQKTEKTLWDDFVLKQARAANLEPLEALLAEMKQSLGEQLRLLPKRTEIDDLLVDISQSGLASGLEFELFKPESEQPAEFYAIQPIRITVTGSYHEFGNFISAVAALPRIVTQHEVAIAPRKGQKTLVMNMVAKTYRYMDEQELAQRAEAADAKSSKKGRKKRKKRKKKK